MQRGGREEKRQGRAEEVGERRGGRGEEKREAHVGDRGRMRTLETLEVK